MEHEVSLTTTSIESENIEDYFSFSHLNPATFMNASKTAILYQNDEKTVTLIDIPFSISLAQIPSEKSLDRILLSSLPLQEPYPSTEPKSDVARAKVLSKMGWAEDAYDYTDLIQKGLEEIRNAHKSSWCLPRKVVPVAPSSHRKHKIEDLDFSGDHLVSTHEPHLSALELGTKLAETSIEPCIYAINAEGRMVTVQNPSLEPAQISSSKLPAVFHIPPHSEMILSSIDTKTAWAFNYEALRLYPNSTSSAGPGQFDFILLDPPWQNRSVTRSKIYKTMRDEDPIKTVRNEMGEHLAPDGLVGCWITNKPNTREAATECFNAWNVDVVEEWVWIKTTANGEPLYKVDGLWRKPYEILLLGRKVESIKLSGPNNVGTTRNISRKLIAGVPDLHSRKPSLKSLIEPLMPDSREYRALEIFARNMTTGWLAYGDETLKFSCSKYWAEISSMSDRVSS